MKKSPLIFILATLLCGTTLTAQNFNDLGTIESRLDAASRQSKLQVEVQDRLETRGWRLEEGNRGTDQEVTADDYCEFLNDVAATDLHSFYEKQMKCIVRLGKPGYYRYEVMDGKENVPITYISENVAMSYCDWLEHAASTSNFNYCNVASGHVAVYDEQLRSNRLIFSISSEVEEISGKSSKPGSTDSWRQRITEGIAALAVLFGGEARGRSVEGEGVVIPRSSDSTTRTSSSSSTGMTFHSTPPEEHFRMSSGGGVENEVVEPPCDPNSTTSRISSMDSMRRRLFPTTPSREVSVARSSQEDAARDQSPGSFQGTAVARVSSEINISTILKKNSEDSEERLYESARKPKTVTFDDSPESITAISESENAFVDPLQEESSEWLLHDEALRTYSLRFAQMRNRLIKTLLTLPKKEREQSAAAATLYTTAYPEIRNFLQEMLLAIQDNPSAHNEQVAQFLADATMKTIVMASRTVAPENWDPIKENRLHFVFHHGEKMLGQTIKRSFELVDETEVMAVDREDEMILDAANDALHNLKEIKAVFKSAPEAMGKALLESQEKRACRTSQLAQKKYYSVSARWDLIFLTPDKTYDQATQLVISEEEKAAAAVSEKSRKALTAIRKSEPLSDVATVREIAIDEIFHLIQPGLVAADALLEMLARRKMH